MGMELEEEGQVRAGTRMPACGWKQGSRFYPRGRRSWRGFVLPVLGQLPQTLSTCECHVSCKTKAPRGPATKAAPQPPTKESHCVCLCCSASEKAVQEHSDIDLHVVGTRGVLASRLREAVLPPGAPRTAGERRPSLLSRSYV